MPFANGGLFKRLRADLYFKPRSKEREKELKELCRDVDYYMAELRRLERRTGCPPLVSAQLTNFCIRLRYWENRSRYKTDLECFTAIATEFSKAVLYVQIIIMDETLFDAPWLNEVEAGKEDE